MGSILCGSYQTSLTQGGQGWDGCAFNINWSYGGISPGADDFGPITSSTILRLQSIPGSSGSHLSAFGGINGVISGAVDPLPGMSLPCWRQHSGED